MMAAYDPSKKTGTNSFKSSGSRRRKSLQDDSNTAPNMKRLSPSEKSLNAKGKKGAMQPTKQGSGRKMTNKTKSYAKMTMKNPDLY